MPYLPLRHPSLESPVLIRSAALLVLALALLACNVQATATPAPIPTPTIAPTVPIPTPTYPMPAPTGPTGENSPTSTPPVPGPAFVDYWQPPTDYYDGPIYSGTLRIGSHYPFEHANVWGAASYGTDLLRAPTGATLVMADPYNPGGPVIPDLARRWEIHEAGDGVTFHFREFALWHPEDHFTTWESGKPFTCEDARFSLETMITGNGLTSSYMQEHLSNIALREMVCLDDVRLEVKFDGPTAIPLHSLSNSRAIVFNKAWFQEGGEEAMFNDISMGIGPFRWTDGHPLESFSNIREVDKQRFERNLDYFIPELPYVDELVIHGIVDDAARQAAHLAHQTDWVWIRDEGEFRTSRYWDASRGESNYRLEWVGEKGHYQSYVEHGQINTVVRPTRRSYRIAFDTERPPFDNVRVRQAIMMGIGRSAFTHFATIDDPASGFGNAWGSPWALPENSLCSVPGWCVSDDMEATRAEARVILEKEGFDYDETYTLGVQSDRKHEVIGAHLQNQLGLLGIQTDLCIDIGVRPHPRSSCHLELFGASIPADDPNAGVETYLNCDSITEEWTPYVPCDSSITHLLDQARVELDAAKRLALAHEIELALMKQYQQVPILWWQEGAAFWPEVRGYVHFPHRRGSFLKFMHLWIDPAHADDTGYAGQVSGVPGGI